ncbi:MAG: sulfite exporter TauE/SafE family protein [Clostridiales bacterium]|nr:sulfite exporter TauE/SafE family protein [Clostridiales bacterium]
MEQNLIRKVLFIDGMTCAGCEMRIENKLKKINGVENVQASFQKSKVEVHYNPKIIPIEKIIETIEKLDYRVKNKQNEKSISNQNDDKFTFNQLIGIGIILFAVYLIIKNTVGFNFVPNISQNMGYGILFVVGLITSLHCIAMCGGINLSQCVSYQSPGSDSGGLSKLKPSLMYNTGRVISYTVVGGIVGALGSVISFSGVAKGIVAILSGIFMIIMGLNMLNIFPWLRKLNPRMPKLFGKKIHENGKHGPFYVGLLNGLMPCGPLQAMQIYALGTGNFVTGALSMFIFSLGTVPLMFGFGALSSLLSRKFTHKMMKVSAMLVMILGIVMMNRGFALSGISFTSGLAANASGSSSVAKIEGNIQVVSTKLQSGSYTPIAVQKGIPVKWTIEADAKDINGCNETITIPKYNISKTLKAGKNEIDFTPDTEGNIPYSCWMGMIRSNIKVVSDVSAVSTNDIKQAIGSSNAVSSGGCCGSTPPGFANGKIPTDNIGIAKINGNEQDVTVSVGSQGYAPAVVVLQKGIPAKIKFDTVGLNGCNSIVVFPEYNGQLNLNQQKETPLLTPQADFTFQCGMGMLHGYVKVVDDLNKIDLNAIKKEIKNYTPSGGGSGGCCG